MTIQLKKLFGTVAVLAALVAAPAMAEEDKGAWDTDGDSALNADEFNTGWGTAMGGESAYDSWDMDRDGNLTEDEFNTGVFNSYDRDGSGVIDEPEFGDVGDDMGDGGFWDV